MYSHLSLAEREEIAIGLAAGKSMSEIARMLGRHVSSIYRELSRNMPDIREVRYRANRAQARADKRKYESRQRERLANPIVRAFVETCIIDR
jgi:IS30 family transposase